MDRNPDQIAAIAALLLSGRFDAEAHQIKSAVATARAILDEVDPPAPAAVVEPEVPVEPTA